MAWVISLLYLSWSSIIHASHARLLSLLLSHDIKLLSTGSSRSGTLTSQPSLLLTCHLHLCSQSFLKKPYQATTSRWPRDILSHILYYFSTGHFFSNTILCAWLLICILLKYQWHKSMVTSSFVNSYISSTYTTAQYTKKSSVTAEWMNESHPTSYVIYPSFPGMWNPFIWSMFCNFLCELGRGSFNYKSLNCIKMYLNDIK